MVELRRNAEPILRRVAHGERFVLSYRGRTVAQLQPVEDELDTDGKRFFGLCGSVTMPHRSLMLRLTT